MLCGNNLYLSEEVRGKVSVRNGGYQAVGIYTTPIEVSWNLRQLSVTRSASIKTQRVETESESFVVEQES